MLNKTDGPDGGRDRPWKAPARQGGRKNRNRTTDSLERASFRGRMVGLAHAAGHKTADGRTQGAFDRPNHRSTGAVWLGDYGVVRNDNPLSFQADPVMAVFRFPIRIGQRKAIRIRAAESLAALESIEPRFQWRIRVSPVVTRYSCSQGSNGQSEDRRTFDKAPIAHVYLPPSRKRRRDKSIVRSKFRCGLVESHAPVFGMH